MTNKQLKKTAKKIADLEQIIQTATDSDSVERGKRAQCHLLDSLDLSLDEMIEIDSMVMEIMAKKI